MWRLQVGLTQRQAALKLGIGESTYGFLESGRMRPSHAQLRRLRRFFPDPESLFESVRDHVECRA
jgi:transcriptional regulator with XRE-family HTH domain